MGGQNKSMINPATMLIILHYTVNFKFKLTKEKKSEINTKLNFACQVKKFESTKKFYLTYSFNVNASTPRSVYR